MSQIPMYEEGLYIREQYWSAYYYKSKNGGWVRFLLVRDFEPGKNWNKRKPDDPYVYLNHAIASLSAGAADARIKRVKTYIIEKCDLTPIKKQYFMELL